MYWKYFLNNAFINPVEFVLITGLSGELIGLGGKKKSIQNSSVWQHIFDCQGGFSLGRNPFK